ncbi:MAG: hypothetical protein HYX73_00995 [Acidobacteria bacterium]|nr:hypothetical protein [Acidobacteriota bacterium]
MFETSQQEPSGHDTKIVAGVIVVLMVVLAVLYFAYGFHSEAPATPQASAPAAAVGPANTPVPDAEPLMDLAILRNNLGRDQTQTMAMWDLQVSNRSREITYRNIQYATNYYDASGNVIYQGSGVLPGEIAPGGQETFSGINDGLYPLATVRYTIELRSADGFKP